MALTLSDIRNALQNKSPITSGSLTLSLARTVLGYDQLANTNTFLSTLASDGPFMLIGGGSLIGQVGDNLSGGNGSRYRVRAELWIGITRSSDNTLRDIETFVKAITDAWYTYVPVENITFDEPVISTERNPAIVKYTITAEVTGC
jgi:hypothetical protein